MSEGGAGRAQAAQLNQQAEQLIDQRNPLDAEPLLRQAVTLDPGSAIAWNNLGRALNNLRRLDEAEVALRRSVELDPDADDAWFNLGHVQRAIGRLDAAESSARQTLSLQETRDPRAVRLLASLRVLQGDVVEAIDLLQQARMDHPFDALLLLELGSALRSAELFDEAKDVLRECLDLDEENPDVLAELGTVYHACIELEPSIDHFRQALDRAPGHPVAKKGLAMALELDRDYQHALDHVLPHLSDEDPGWAVSTAGRLLCKLDRSPEARELLEAADVRNMEPTDRVSILTTLGQLREEAGDYDAAFGSFAAANACLPSRFGPREFRHSVDRIVTFFSREHLNSLPTSDCDSEMPVFVVGMPRSGTSMIEQIMGQHTQVDPCGERRFIFRLPKKLSDGDAKSRWPEILDSIDAKTLGQLAGEYLETALVNRDTCLRFTDKLPANFLNLGLIQLLFPRARVVYCRRDPLDTGLSCFQQNFRSEGMDYTRDLAHIGVQQQACWRLMDHWMDTLSLPIHVINYEHLVENPEIGAKALIEFLGLDWEPACLDFHLSNRRVKTASYEQVRKPIYTSSVGRWRQYEPWLGPLKTALAAPWDDQSAR